ncbi:unnamed protein product [Ectocarpus sp. CCAP 1310/34]|nr:unnamed protein product [Ectocarpus sp. CCAP 1310/34]
MLNLKRQASRIGRKLQEYKKVMMFHGDIDIPGVRRVLAQALKDGKSPIAMLGTLEAAFQGRYRARAHTQDDLDLAMLVLRVGGPSQLFSLSQALCLPSVTSVYVEMKKRHMSFAPCASLKYEILEPAVMANLQAVVEVYGGRSRLFQSQVDEIAQEKHARHYQNNDTILGLCAQCTGESNVYFKNINHVERLGGKLKKGEIHLGSEKARVQESAQPLSPRGVLQQLQGQPNVPLAVKMMQPVVSVAAADKSTFAGLDASPTMQAALEDMQVLASITEPLLDVLLTPEKTISELLRELARVAFLLLFVYRMNKTRFIPDQLYHDLQATIRVLFYVVLKSVGSATIRVLFYVVLKSVGSRGIVLTGKLEPCMDCMRAKGSRGRCRGGRERGRLSPSGVFTLFVYVLGRIQISEISEGVLLACCSCLSLVNS